MRVWMRGGLGWMPVLSKADWRAVGLSGNCFKSLEMVWEWFWRRRGSSSWSCGLQRGI